MTTAENQDFTFVLGARQASVALFVAVVMLGTVGGISYVAGRAIEPAAAVAAAPPPVAVPENVEQPPPVPPTPASYFRNPQPGELFLQVVAVDRGPAEVFAEYLTRKGFSSQVATGPDEHSYRVLVGPILSSDDVSSLRGRLESEGFRPFLQRY